jgi:hypothetical protein
MTPKRQFLVFVAVSGPVDWMIARKWRQCLAVRTENDEAFCLL